MIKFDFTYEPLDSSTGHGELSSKELDFRCFWSSIDFKSFTMARDFFEVACNAAYLLGLKDARNYKSEELNRKYKEGVAEIERRWNE